MFGGWGKPPPPASPLERLTNVIFQGASTQLQTARIFANAHLDDTEPWQLLFLGALLFFILSRLLALFGRARRTLTDKGWRQLFFGFLLDLPGVRGVVARQQASAVAKLRAGLQKDRTGAAIGPSDAITILPKEGISAAQVKARMMRKAAGDVRFAEGDSRVSGAVYLTGTSHQLLLNEVYKQFSITNPMHADVFPSVRKMVRKQP
jgi:sphinganine-1-phosphate aldolase